MGFGTGEGYNDFGNRNFYFNLKKIIQDREGNYEGIIDKSCLDRYKLSA